MSLIETLALVAAIVVVGMFVVFEAARPWVLVAVDNSSSMGRLERPDLSAIRSGAGLRFFHKVTVVAFNHDEVTEVRDSKLPTPWGATSYARLDSWLVDHGDGYDQIVVVTDGDAEQVDVADPERWTWLLTEDHTPEWLADSPAQVRHLVAT